MALSRSLDHVVKFLGCQFISRFTAVILMEYCPYTLDSYIAQVAQVEYDTRRKIDLCFDCIEVLTCLSKGLKVVHSDIKANNLFVNAKAKCVVGDFGRVMNITNGDVFRDASSTKSASTWSPKHYHIHKLNRSVFGDPRVDLFSMVWCILLIVLGRDDGGVLTGIKRTKRVDIGACVSVCGERFVRLLEFCKQVLESDDEIQVDYICKMRECVYDAMAWDVVKSQ